MSTSIWWCTPCPLLQFVKAFLTHFTLQAFYLFILTNKGGCKIRPRFQEKLIWETHKKFFFFTRGVFKIGSVKIPHMNYGVYFPLKWKAVVCGWTACVFPCGIPMYFSVLQNTHGKHCVNLASSSIIIMQLIFCIFFFFMLFFFLKHL